MLFRKHDFTKFSYGTNKQPQKGIKNTVDGLPLSVNNCPKVITDCKSSNKKNRHKIKKKDIISNDSANYLNLDCLNMLDSQIYLNELIESVPDETGTSFSCGSRNEFEKRSSHKTRDACSCGNIMTDSKVSKKKTGKSFSGITLVSLNDI